MLRRWGSGVILAPFRIITYIAPLAVFLLLMGVNNRFLLVPSRTMAVCIATFCVAFALLIRIYGGYRIGRQKSKAIIAQMSLAAAWTDVITYCYLKVMNVNLTGHRVALITGDLLMLLATLLIQVVFFAGMTYLGNYLYFRYHKPLSCLIVTSDRGDDRILRRKIGKLKKQFRVDRTIDPADPGLLQAVEQADAIFLYRLPAGLHQQLIEDCYRMRKQVYFDQSVADVVARGAETFVLDDIMMTAHIRSGLTLSQRFVKRIVDLVISGLGLILLSPLMLLIAAAIRLEDHGPVFFRQARMTRGGKTFRICKFRTMYVHDSSKDSSVISDDDRITKVGRILRRIRVDELPQLWNIFLGEMSVVGPRPEMLSNVELYTGLLPEFDYRNRVKAGLTGYAQILGKYDTSPREKLIMDISYIESYSLGLDLKLILQTLTVFFRKDSTEAFSVLPGEEEKE